MKEIKFRAVYEDKIYDVASIIFGDYFVNKKFVRLVGGKMLFSVNLEDVILCQFTGLKDRNGKDIYEDDILATSNDQNNDPNCDVWNKNDYGYTLVYWDDVSAAFKGSHWQWDNDKENESVYYMGYVETLGNKFVNAELLK
jgi:uncharacterized phage protein (TIGR01671 family)